jgi:hypothetical protein
MNRLADLQRQRDEAEAEADAIQVELDNCVSALRRITMERQLGEVVREINQIDTVLNRKRK